VKLPAHRAALAGHLPVIMTQVVNLDMNLGNEQQALARGSSSEDELFPGGHGWKSLNATF
jgi:hypothetical protein